MKFRIHSSATEFGGGERYLSLLIPALRERGHLVELVLGSSRAPAELRRLSLGISSASTRDCVVVFNGIGALWRWGTKFPMAGSAFLYVHHTSIADDQASLVRRSLRPLMFSLLSRRLQAVIRVCKAAQLPKCIGCPVYTVYNGVPRSDRRAVSRGAGDNFVIGMLGSINENKNQKAAIRILSALPGEFSLKLIGDGPQRGQLERLSQELGVAERIEWTGYTELPIRELEACHVLLMLSRNEALPYSALEAMSIGVPLVSYDVGGLPELISHGVNGLLVRAGEEGQIKEHLELLARDEALRYSLAQEAQDTVEHSFGVDAMTGGFLDVTTRAVAARAHSWSVESDANT